MYAAAQALASTSSASSPTASLSCPRSCSSARWGLYLCSRVTARVRGDKEVRILRTLSEVSTLFLYVILPLLAAAALIETYVTPRLLAMVL